VRNGFYCGAEGSILPEVGSHKIPFSGEGTFLASTQAEPVSSEGQVTC